MIRFLCAGLVATVCLVGVAAATDLSMTPIYKSRPSAATAPDGRLKAEYQPSEPVNIGRIERPSSNAVAGVIETPREPVNRPLTGGNGGF